MNRNPRITQSSHGNWKEFHQYPIISLATHGDMTFSYKRRRTHFSFLLEDLETTNQTNNM
jgi:hypothetical protein